MKQDTTKYTKYNRLCKFLLTVFIISCLSFVFSCSKKEDKAKEQAPVKVLKKRSPKPVIARVDLDPAEPSVIDFIRVVPVLEDPGMQQVKFRFQWYVNGKEIPGDSTRLLEQQYYKKGDSVYCRVSAARGALESKTINSPVIKIRNAVPVIDPVTVGKFKVPGHFYYKIQAHDPDGDSLAYYLVEPVIRGLQLNSDTGEIQWDILELPESESDTPPPKPEDENAEARKKNQPTAQPGISSRLQIVFDVRDTDDGVTRGAITIDLTKGREVPQ